MVERYNDKYNFKTILVKELIRLLPYLMWISLACRYP